MLAWRDGILQNSGIENAHAPEKLPVILLTRIPLRIFTVPILAPTNSKHRTPPTDRKSFTVNSAIIVRLHNKTIMLKAKAYIDGANMFYSQKKLGWSFDWEKIKQVVGKDKEVIEWRYYVGVKDEDEKMQKYLRYLDAIGFTAFTKPLKKIWLDHGEATTENKAFIYKANFDVEIAVDILLDKTSVDEVILFSGDSDFKYLIKKLRDSGKKVGIYSSRKTISWELKLGASNITYLEDMKESIARK